MSKLTVKTGDEKEFFMRGKKLAKLADQGKHLPAEGVVSFEDPVELLRLLTTARLALFKAVKEQPGSIAAIAERLHRNRSAVKRDIDELSRAGLVHIESKTLPGHGKMQEVRPVATSFKLEATLA